MGAPGKSLWCTRRDLNPHTSRHKNLNLTCLPIPPRVRKRDIVLQKMTFPSMRNFKKTHFFKNPKTSENDPPHKTPHRHNDFQTGFVSACNPKNRNATCRRDDLPYSLSAHAKCPLTSSHTNVQTIIPNPINNTFLMPSLFYSSNFSLRMR